MKFFIIVLFAALVLTARSTITTDGTTTETTEKTNDSSSTSTSSVTILSTDPVPPKVQGVERKPENKTKEIVTTPDPISSKLPSDPKANVNNNTEPARVNSTGINKTSPLSPTSSSSAFAQENVNKINESATRGSELLVLKTATGASGESKDTKDASSGQPKPSENTTVVISSSEATTLDPLKTAGATQPEGVSVGTILFCLFLAIFVCGSVAAGLFVYKSRKARTGRSQLPDSVDA